MSAGYTSTEVDALTKQVEALERDTAALSQAIASARKTRMVLLVLVVLFLGLTIGLFYNLGNRLMGEKNQKVLMQLAEERLSQQTGPLMKEVQTLVDNTHPVLTAAFTEQAKKDLPAYMNALQKERDQFSDNLQTRLQKKLEEQHEKLISKHEKLMAEELSFADDAELRSRMMGNLYVVVDRLVKKYYIDELKTQFQTMYDTWDEFPVSDAPGNDDLPLEDQLFATLLELLTQKLAHSQASAQP